MWGSDTPGQGGVLIATTSSSVPPSQTTASHFHGSSSIKNGIGLAWAVSGGGNKAQATTPASEIVGSGLGLGNGGISMANVLDFLLTSTQLHRVAAATLDKVRNGGRVLRGGVGATGASSSSSSSSPSSNITATATTTALPLPAKTWSRLLTNPGAAAQEQTLALLQVALQDGLLDSILPYMVSSLNLGGGLTTLTPTQNVTPAPGARSRTPTPTNKLASSTMSTSKSSHRNRSPSRDRLAREAARETSARRSPTPTLSRASPTTAPAPTPSIATTSSNNNYNKNNNNNVIQEDIRMIVPQSSIRSLPDRSPAIVIHVCDEARGLRQDFTCPRDLLIHHIGYFADVTAGQRLEDVDISVHCDVSIFEWLLRWVKQGQTEDHVAPTLEPKTAVSILISADFLKMSPLVEEVLHYVHDNMNLILEAQVNLNCLSDTILTRLSRLFTHWELEGLRDRRDRIQNKLYARFLQALCEPIPAASRGIFRTAATIYRCGDCKTIVSRAVERLVDCVPSNTSITTTGHVFYTHSRDPAWSLTEHVRQLKTELKTWRLVYWRLWGQVHFLPCSTCGAVFPGCEMKQCLHHRLDSSACDVDILLNSDNFPCCGARALRFSPLPVRNGCQMSDHTVQLSQGEEETYGPIPLIYDDLLTFQLLICLDPPKFIQPEQKNVLWSGVPLVPSSNRGERSFLDRSWLSHYLHGERDGHAGTRAGASESGTAATPGVTMGVGTGVSSESSSDEEEGGCRPGLTQRFRANLIRRANRARRAVACEVMPEPSWRWDAGRSTRHNQDSQRERETRVLRDLTSWLTLAAPNDTGHGHRGHRGRQDRRREVTGGPDPGIYYRLEADFRERHGGHTHTHAHSGGGGGTFRAKVQAISRIKMRLRHRAAFSASR